MGGAVVEAVHQPAEFADQVGGEVLQARGGVLADGDPERFCLEPAHLGCETRRRTMGCQLGMRHDDCVHD
jgi:hypothetical protein